jgi:GNAT superfamily N-acetyltransferase
MVAVLALAQKTDSSPFRIGCMIIGCCWPGNIGPAVFLLPFGVLRGDRVLGVKETEMDIRIRRAEAADVPPIADLLRSLGLFAHINAEASSVTEERVGQHLALCTADDSHLVLVAETSGGGIAGYCAVHWLPYLILAGPEGYVSELFVRDEFRGQGIGSRLLEAVKTEALNRGCSRLMLLNMRKRESYQRQFYVKQGWEERPDAANFVLQLVGSV